MEILHFVLGAFVGFAGARTVSGRKEGERGKLASFVVRIRGRMFHFHHWFIASTLLITTISLGLYNAFSIGLLTAVTAQGLTYKDRFHIIYRAETSSPLPSLEEKI